MPTRAPHVYDQLRARSDECRKSHTCWSFRALPLVLSWREIITESPKQMLMSMNGTAEDGVDQVHDNINIAIGGMIYQNVLNCMLFNIS